MDIVIVGIDLGKNSCSLPGLDATGCVLLRRRLRRESLEAFVSKLERCVVAMQACCGAHHLGRIFAAQGYEVRLMSPEYVRPYVKAHKNDDLDAEAIAEAATRPTMRFAPVKEESQSDIQALHRARERLVSERTALINHLRALLLERGIVVPQGRRKLQAFMESLAAEDGGPGLSSRMKALVCDLRAEWRSLDEKNAAFDAEFVQMAREDEAARRLTKIPGIGTINATALVAAIGDATANVPPTSNTPLDSVELSRSRSAGIEKPPRRTSRAFLAQVPAENERQREDMATQIGAALRLHSSDLNQLAAALLRVSRGAGPTGRRES